MNSQSDPLPTVNNSYQMTFHKGESLLHKNEPDTYKKWLIPLIVVIVSVFIITLALYWRYEPFTQFIDNNILKKESFYPLITQSFSQPVYVTQLPPRIYPIVQRQYGSPCHMKNNNKCCNGSCECMINGVCSCTNKCLCKK
jgi:hypothetical protein